MNPVHPAETAGSNPQPHVFVYYYDIGGGGWNSTEKGRDQAKRAVYLQPRCSFSVLIGQYVLIEVYVLITPILRSSKIIDTLARIEEIPPSYLSTGTGIKSKK
ncbi:hypothetical protein DFH27DRAFT_528182 [Peziza echinospora]|nr:hypothetical protein DFH27DRAFT_528182 [Peziza echinospora]